MKLILPICAALLLAGCLSHGHYQWRAFPVESGYWVDCDFRTDVEGFEKLEWKKKAEDAAVSVIRTDFATRGIRVDDCVVKYMSVNQGSLVLVSVLVGDRAFIEKWKDEQSAQIRGIATANKFTLEGKGSISLPK